MFSKFGCKFTNNVPAEVRAETWFWEDVMNEQEVFLHRDVARLDERFVLVDEMSHVAHRFVCLVFTSHRPSFLR